MSANILNNNNKPLIELNKIYKMDCLKLINKLEDNSIDLIVTDPPYLFNWDTNRQRKSNIASLDKISTGLNHIADGFDIEVHFKEYRRIMKKLNIFMFCSNSQLLESLEIGKKYDLITNVLVWYKTNATPFANGVWKSDLEFIVHFREEGAVFQGASDIKSKIYISPVEISKFNHPTEKPIKLIEKFIKIGSNKNDVVLDPFMGSGTTGAVCINLNRQFIGAEINEEYFKTAINRCLRATGKVGLFE